MAHKNIHRTVLTRLAFAWLLLSLVLGAIVFYLEMGKADTLMLELAMTESRSFTDHMDQEDIAHLEMLKQKANDFLKSGFISVRLDDTDQRKILEVAEPSKDEAGLGIKPHVHPLSPGDRAQHQRQQQPRQCEACQNGAMDVLVRHRCGQTSSSSSSIRLRAGRVE